MPSRRMKWRRRRSALRTRCTRSQRAEALAMNARDSAPNESDCGSAWLAAPFQPQRLVYSLPDSVATCIA